MSPAQLALAVSADAKWIQNARRILSRPAAYDAREARWLGLVHELHSSLGCSLGQAARVADLAMAAPVDQRSLRIAFGGDERVELVIDLWRDRTIHLVRLSRALTMPPREHRGRPSTQRSARGSVLTRAATYGVDVTRVRAGLGRTVSERLARLDDNAAFIAAGRASLSRRRARA